MPIVHVTQAVLCQLEHDPDLYRLTIFGNESVLDNYDTRTPLFLINNLNNGCLASSFDPTVLYQLVPLHGASHTTPIGRASPTATRASTIDQS